MYVSHVASSGKSGHGCQVSAVSSHDLDDENSTLRSGGRLPDPVADFGDLVESGVTAKGEIGAGDVVADGGRQDDDRDPEFRKFVPIFGHEEGCVERLEPSDEQKAVDVFIRQRLRNSCIFSDGKRSLCSEYSSAGVSPSVDGFPGERFDFSGLETFNSVVDSERVMSGDDAVPHERTDSWK